MGLGRDGGFAVGALLAGALADLFGVTAAIRVVAGITAFSGLVVAARMYETLRAQPIAPTLQPLLVSRKNTVSL